MKDYEHIILWLDYFNKNLKRRHGRRVKRDLAVSDPTIQDLAEAARSAGFECSEQEMNGEVKFPRRSFVKSGYIMVIKKEDIRKTQVIESVAKKLLQRKSRQKIAKK